MVHSDTKRKKYLVKYLRNHVGLKYGTPKAKFINYRCKTHYGCSFINITRKLL